MKLPLRISYRASAPRVVDDDGRVVCDLINANVSVAEEIVRHFKGDWRWRFFRRQPYA